MTPALPDQAADIAAFLTQRRETAMFPLSNLLTHGMGGTHPHSTRFWIVQDGAQITDALGLTSEGMILPVLRPAHAPRAVAALSGQSVIGIVGPADTARALEAAAGLVSAHKTLDADEPHFALDLADLTLPQGPGTLRPLADAPRDAVLNWMMDYHIATLGTPPDQAGQRAARWYDQATTTGSHMALIEGDTPLAMTGFNARAPGIVQIGGVYTPPALRGRGHARRAVALHLAQARTKGVARATLFSASDSAARAYVAIGFRRIGTWSLILFAAPQVLQ